MSEKLTPALIQRVRDSAARLASYYEVREGHRDLGVPATFLRPLNDICDAAERSLSYVVSERSTVIEECARVCDLLAGLNVQGWGRKSTCAAQKCATEIRALKR